MNFQYIPKELLHIILKYDGKIKYRNGTYVNIIHKNDERYNIIKPIISKKIKIIKKIHIHESGFYFEFAFDIDNGIGLCYDYNYSYKDKFEICYFDWRNNNIKQIRIYL